MSDAPSAARSEANTRALAVFAAGSEMPAINDLLQRLRRPAAMLRAGGPAEAMAWCGQNPPVEVLLVDISADPHPLTALLELAAQTGPACRIIALGDRADVDFYRQLLQAGIFDYLLKPLRMDLLAEVLARADDDQRLGEGGPARAGRTLACVGCAGGLGTSTLVAALGQWLAGRQLTPTVLVDFDRRKADLPLLLGLEADAGLASLLEAPSIDPRLLQRTLIDAGASASAASPHRLQLLTQTPGPELPVDPERLLELGAALCQSFSLSLWDLPSHRPSGSDEVLAHADIRIVLTELSVQGARACHRLLREIGDESAGQRLLLLSSGARQSARPALEAEQFEDFVGRTIDLHLPQAGPALAGSLLAGPLNSAAAPLYAEAIEQLGRRLLGQPAPAPVAMSLTAQLQRWLSSLRRPADAAAPV